MTTGQRREGPRDRRYRFGFVLNTTLGNLTRYQNLRKYAERDPEVESFWAPVSHYTPPDHPSRLRFLPEPLFMRVRVLQQAWPVLKTLGGLDAVMVHLFEADVLCSLRSYVAKRPLHISSNDEAPIIDRSTYPLYPHELAKPVWRQKLRLALDHWRVRHTDEFIPFSRWVSTVLVEHCSAPADRVHPIHVGIDLELWKPRPAGCESARRQPAADPVRRQRFRSQRRRTAARCLPRTVPGNRGTASRDPPGARGSAASRSRACRLPPER